MSKNPIDIANQLIKKGELLKNPEFIKMGKDILAKHTAKNNSFTTTMRDDSNEDRNIYDESGNKIGTRTRKEPISSNFVNKFQDNFENTKDLQNEKLKSVTVRVERNRNAPNYVSASCASCGKIEQVNPIHVASNHNYRCVQCIKGLRH